MAVGVIKVVAALVVMGAMAWLLYAFNVLSIGPWLLPFAVNLVLFGYILGLLSVALVVRFGGRWQIIAWGLPWMVMPFSSVYWPESVLPPFMQTIAQASPMNHVFEGMRAVVTRGEMPLDRLVLASVENVLYLALTAAVVGRTFRGALERGALPKLR
jgi:ABC-2 type transport system permease protein